MSNSRYVVWCPSEHQPTKRHESQESAIAEAKRLANTYHDKEFIVLRAIQSVKYASNPMICKQYSSKAKDTSVGF